LLAAGEKIRVVGRDASRLQQFVDQGAEPVLGDVSDAEFMTQAFTGATGVFLVIPQTVRLENAREQQDRISTAYATAMANAGVEYAVTVSSLGAQHAAKTGPILGLHNMEEKLNAVPGLNVLHVRAGHFMENLLMSIEPIRMLGLMPGGFPGDLPLPMIAAKDIGEYAAGRLVRRDFSAHSSMELYGPRDISMKEAADILGAAIGKPRLSYLKAPMMMIEPALVRLGLPKSSVKSIIEMWKGVNDGLIRPTEVRTRENCMPSTLEWFAREVFAPAFRQKETAA
jgi:uncharacterized protein YbjT (DUF2867 family)